MHLNRPESLHDIECFPNYFLICFRKADGEVVAAFEQHDESGTVLDRGAIIRALRYYTLVGFNCLNYDIPLLVYALSKPRTNAELKAASDAIIQGNLRPWQFEELFGVNIPDFIDAIDLSEPAPGVMIGLKQYGGRLHSRRLQDLPYPHDKHLTREEIVVVRDYCGNDLETTGDLGGALKKQMDLRKSMSQEYGIDLRSKSDAQIAEAVIKHEMEKVLGRRIYRPDLPRGTAYNYRVPAWLKYRTPALQQMLDDVRAAKFVVRESGKFLMPAELDKRKIEVGRSTYTMGIGGLHSNEKRTAHFTTADHVIVDRDVASYYPYLILTQRLFPQNLGEQFLAVYKGIVDRRIAAKRSGNKVVADSLKITINGSFGKLGSKWSALYSPDLMVQVTVSGQLYLLLFIEMLELAGIEVISANTDGVVSKVPNRLEARFAEIVKEWERITSLETEETRYRALYSRDVNTYLAVKEKGGFKGKGVMQIDPEEALKKSPQNIIVVEAVSKFLTDGMPIGETIRECHDIRKFVTVKKAGSMGVWRGMPLGRYVRWYRSTESRDFIGIAEKTTAGGALAKVGGSDNAMPVMTLPDRLPADIDYGWYVSEAMDLLKDIGFKWGTQQ
jgi:hypothetical protein